MADALMLQRLGLGPAASFDSSTIGGSITDAINLNSNYGAFGMGMSIFNSPFGMNTAFNTNYMAPYGYGMGMNYTSNPMMGMTYNPSFGGMYGMTQAEMQEWNNLNTEQKEQKMADIQARRMDQTARQQERYFDKQQEINEAAARRQNSIAAPFNAAQEAARNLQLVIRTNRKDEVMEKFGELKAQLAKLPQYQKSVKNADGSYSQQPLDDKEMNAKAREFYAQTVGSDLLTDIDTNLSGSFTQGFKKGLTFGVLGDKKDADMLTEEIAGLQRDGGNVIARGTGRVAGGAATGAAVGAGIGVLFGGVGAVPGAVIGGIVGAVGGFFSSLF